MAYSPRSRVELGGGRGWLTAEAAASIFRIDRAIGHRLQITEAGRSFFQQEEHWLRYLRNGSPIALNPNTPSVHQIGDAIDSDEAQRFVDLMAEHGWVRTVYRWVNGKWTLVERWHFEYFIAKDKHRYDPAPAGGTTTATPIPILEEDTEMQTIQWGVHVFTIGPSYLKHETNGAQANVMGWLFNRNDRMSKGSMLIGVDNDALNGLQKSLSIPWYAFDLVMSGRGFNIEGTRGNGQGEEGRVWSLQHEILAAVRGLDADHDGLAKSLDELLAKLDG